MDKKLKLDIQPRVIDHLGIKMYQKAVDVISEFVANAWDADAGKVEIILGADSILIKDNGVGMSFDECQQKFLTVGRNRRVSEASDRTGNGRPVLGRKGIGKFAGFGIAKMVTVRTVSAETGETTAFIMDLERIISADVSNETAKEIDVVEYSGPQKERKCMSGTEIKLEGLKITIASAHEINNELARRFLLTAADPDFLVTVNGEMLGDAFTTELEFAFPKDLSESELSRLPNPITIVDGGWAKECFGDTYIIKWRIGFLEHPIDVEGLRGVAIFARGKMAQSPFFFDYSGAMSGQHGLEYMTGQVIMDFIDTDDNDLIATERQRINLQSEMGSKIRAWGIALINSLSRIWKERRAAKRIAILEDKLSPLSARLGKFSQAEQKEIRAVLMKIAGFDRLGIKRFEEWGNAIITSWENGRLKGFVESIAGVENLDETRFIELLTEADVLSSLNIAESIKTKIATIAELKNRVEAKDLENKIRDFIAERPWIVHPKWEGYKTERSVAGIIRDAGNKNFSNDEAYSGRVDLALRAGDDLLLLEFMRPGLELDRSHLDRINWYVTDVRNGIQSITGGIVKRLTSAYVIADKRKTQSDIDTRIAQLHGSGIEIMTWDSLISSALENWKETLAILRQHHPKDERIQQLCDL